MDKALRNIVKAGNLSSLASASNIPHALRKLASDDPTPAPASHGTSLCACVSLTTVCAEASGNTSSQLHLSVTRARPQVSLLSPSFSVATSFCAGAFGVLCLSLPVLLFPFGVGSFRFTWPICLGPLREGSMRESG